ncbi:E3 ubiquitin- ligase RBX1 protein [Rutstroemia sp. NJR-2017a WRK4]|nr:E3 ubiquitin- ligase RBX1 protein [Rutstroemia sp. NJR-2017a WRK4]
MADIDMTDAPPAVAKKGGSKKAAGGEGADGKKRFEVKKVSNVRQIKLPPQVRNALSHGVSAT